MEEFNPDYVHEIGRKYTKVLSVPLAHTEIHTILWLKLLIFYYYLYTFIYDIRCSLSEYLFFTIYININITH
jgi:hypothetical protein